MRNLITILLLLGSFFSMAQERILNYHSEINVNKDRSIEVTETITVQAEGINIKRGITRDIPNVMLDENGDRVKLDLDFIQVLRDGNSTEWITENINNGKRILIYNPDIYLDPGEYTFTIKYTMSDQVRLFSDYDEIYWNATGDQWIFPIEKASATVKLPLEAEIIQHKGYSGGYGSSGCDCDAEEIAPNVIKYFTNSTLEPSEGLTIAVGWNKGVVNPPSEAELKARKTRKFLPMIIMASGIILTFLYYMWAWSRVGKDPLGGPIIARFEAPEGFSPAASRYVLKMGFDNKAFSASIVSMAVKGFLTIDKTGKNYELKKSSQDEVILSPGEKKIAHRLFKSSDSFTIKQSNHSKISSAISDLRTQLKADFRKINFAKNKVWLVPGILLSLATFITTVVFLVDYTDQLTALMLTFFFSIFIVAIGAGIVKAFKGGSLWRKISVMMAPVIFTSVAIYVLYQLIANRVIEMSFITNILPYVLLFITLLVINLLFNYLIQAPTVMGRKRMDEIEGLKLYMEIAEKHRLDKLNPPKETPQLFEALLPFAIALSVENAWSKRFNSVIEKAIAAGEYNPTWYVGPHSYMHMNRISRDLGSDFSSSISAASISPQSSGSSGSGGGGFSGGGGGGGGGGGI